MRLLREGTEELRGDPVEPSEKGMGEEIPSVQKML